MAAIAGYDNTRQQIMDTLADRVVGTEIQPEAHQQFALALLEYVRSVELISASTLIGQCTPLTQPVQPDDANVAYVGAAPQAATTIWTNFHGVDGQPLTTTTTSTSVALCVFTWNKEYWTMTTMTMDITDLLQETNQRIQDLENDLAQEVQDRQNADTALQTNINTETAARQAGDTTLDGKITAEANARSAADTAEAQARANADTTLDEKITAEATARETADITLQTNINTEQQARIEGDNTLDSKISAEATARAEGDEEVENKDKPTTKVYDETLKLHQNVINDNGIIICKGIVDTPNVASIDEGYPYVERDTDGFLVNVVQRTGSNVTRTAVRSGKLYSIDKVLYELHHWYLIEVSYPSRVFDGGRADSQYGGARNVNAGNAAG